MSTKAAVLFDLGGTLAEYYRREEFPEVLRQAIAEVEACVRGHGLPVPPADRLWRSVKAENHEAPNFRVRPLAGRLARIFELPEAVAPDVMDSMCRGFLRPVFARSALYPDAPSTLREIRARRLRTAIVSNTPWGSPPAPWQEEVERLGLRALVDTAVFCAEVGWRKPAPPVFQEAMRRLSMEPGDCLFIGDDPRWDLAGPQALGMDAVLVDRAGIHAASGEVRVRDLPAILDLI